MKHDVEEMHDEAEKKGSLFHDELVAFFLTSTNFQSVAKNFEDLYDSTALRS